MKATAATITIPEALRHLPVAQQLDGISWGARNLVFMAATSSGKTVTLPAVEATMDLRPGPILLREPTKITAQATMNALGKFWPDLQVGISTSANKANLDGADIIVFSDGSLRGLLNRGDPPAAVYFDEAHLMTLHSEMEMGVSRALGLHTRAMSATIEPKRLAEYLGHADVHLLDGRTFPIICDTWLASPDVFHRSDTFQLEGHLQDFCEMLADEGERGLCFLPTKALVEKMAAKCPIEANYLHSDVDPSALLAWVEERKEEPWCIFSTSAGATGITLPITHVLIADEEITSSMERGIETVKSGPMGDGALIQCRGRVGRLKPGTATLLTPHRERNGIDRDRSRWLNLDDRQEVHPRPIDPPCAKRTPYDVRLQVAAMGIPWQDGLLLSQIDAEEMAHAEGWLRRSGLLDAKGEPTQMGRSVANFPMAAQFAHLALTAPSRELKFAILAAFSLGLGGTFRLVQVGPEGMMARRASNPLAEIWPRASVVWGSVPLTLARTLANYASEHDRWAWCNDNNLKHKPFASALEDFERVASRLSQEPIEDLCGIDFEALKAPLWSHLASKDLFRQFTLRGGIAYQVPQFSPFDSVFADSFNLKASARPVRCLAIPRKQVAKRGSVFYPLEMGHCRPEDRP